jgi:hypothetical protein
MDLWETLPKSNHSSVLPPQPFWECTQQHSWNRSQGNKGRRRTARQEAKCQTTPLPSLCKDTITNSSKTGLSTTPKVLQSYQQMKRVIIHL